MIVMMAVVMGVLMTRVLPVFNEVFLQLGTELSGVSLSILRAGQALSRYSVLLVVLAVVVVMLVLLTILFLRPRTWNRFALKTNIESQVQPVEIEKQVEVGVQGITLTRLAPMGKVQIDGQIFEAKSLDSYIDPRQEVIVIGYDNATLVVRGAE